jgi:hypothetical protein
MRKKEIGFKKHPITREQVEEVLPRADDEKWGILAWLDYLELPGWKNAKDRLDLLVLVEDLQKGLPRSFGGCPIALCSLRLPGVVLGWISSSTHYLFFETGDVIRYYGIPSSKKLITPVDTDQPLPTQPTRVSFAKPSPTQTAEGQRKRNERKRLEELERAKLGLPPVEKKERKPRKKYEKSEFQGHLAVRRITQKASSK